MKSSKRQVTFLSLIFLLKCFSKSITIRHLKVGVYFLCTKKNGGGTFFSRDLQKWSDEVWLCLFYVSHKNRILRT